MVSIFRIGFMLYSKNPFCFHKFPPGAASTSSHTPFSCMESISDIIAAFHSLESAPCKASFALKGMVAIKFILLGGLLTLGGNSYPRRQFFTSYNAFKLSVDSTSYSNIRFSVSGFCHCIIIRD